VGEQSEQSEAKVFRGGVPVGPEVKALMEQLAPGWQEGEVLPYSRIEAIAGCAWRSNRFRTILDSWRRRLMREQNIDTEVVPGVGVRRLTPGERIRASQGDGRSAARKLRRAVVRVHVVPGEKLSEAERHSKDHTERVMSGALQSLQQACRTFDAPKPQAQLPRPAMDPTKH
jgi:hypothetical protein